MLTHVGLFEGSGIPSLAAAAVGIKTTAYSEVDPACCYALAKLWPDAIPLGDVKTADWSRVPRPVFILTAGVPCQPVSTAGKQKGDKDDRWLWPETIRAVRELRPSWLLFENPRAIVLHGLERIVEELEGIGYDFIPKGRDGRYAPICVGADDVGAPHRRKRVWIVGRLADTIGRVRRSRGRQSKRRPEGGIAAGRTGADVADGTCQHGGQRERLGECEADSARTESRPEGCGSGVGHPARDDQRREAGAAMHGPRKPVGGSSGSRDMGDAIGTGLAIRTGEPGDDGRQQPAVERTGYELADDSRGIGIQRSERKRVGICRWPARPGQPQYAWEAPRLIEFGMGVPTDGLARSVLDSLGGSGNGIPPHRAASRANKSLLRMCGNGWVYKNALLLFMWIASQE